MKKLAVMRHATAGSASIDYERPLTTYGIAQAKDAGEYLKALINPQLVLVSGAKRTRMTASAVNEIMNLDERLFQFDDRIYESSLMNLTCRIQEISADVDEVILIGHNPGVSMLVAALTGQRCSYSPGSFAVVELDIESWADLEKGNLVSQFSPV